MTDELEVGQGCQVYPHVTEAKAKIDVSLFDIAPWARWVAVDASGAVWQYSVKPIQSFRIWRLEDDADDSASGSFLGHISMTGIDWTQTLTPVNQEQPAPAQLDTYSVDASWEWTPAPKPAPDTVDVLLLHNAIPYEFAATVLAHKSASWAERLVAELLALMPADNQIATIVSLWLALDGQQECDLAVAMAKADERRADEFSTTLGEAVQPTQLIDALPHKRQLAGHFAGIVEAERRVVATEAVVDVLRSRINAVLDDVLETPAGEGEPWDGGELE